METSGIKYIGSKLNLLDAIMNMVDEHIPVSPGAKKRRSMIDVFTGTTRVAQAFRQYGWATQTSDLSWASECYAQTFLQMNDNNHLKPVIDSLNKVKPKNGWLTQNYCDSISEKGTPVRVWQPKNGQKADAIRDSIEIRGKRLTPQEKSTLITALIFGLDKVDNTVGIQQAYLKSWCTRSYKDLIIELPQVVTMKSPPPNKHYVGDCLKIKYDNADLAYLDPPYSSHTYFSYYHIWDSIARWDKPEVGLHTNRRIDRVTSADEYDDSMASPWNSKTNALQAFNILIKRLPVKYVLISYSSDSLISIDDLIELCKNIGKTVVNQIVHRRHLMSQLVGADVGEKNNKEYLILVKK
jgi:adenine-specific DNA-methyltransferase